MRHVHLLSARLLWVWGAAADVCCAARAAEGASPRIVECYGMLLALEPFALRNQSFRRHANAHASITRYRRANGHAAQLDRQVAKHPRTGRSAHAPR
jgi:hypothetical protein